MNAEQMIELVIGIVDDPDHEDTEIVLGHLNDSQKRLADDLFLPDLEDGFDTIDTLVDAWEVPFPETYHKGLYLAQADGVTLNVHKDMRSMALALGGLTMEAGDVKDICARSSGTIMYQAISDTVSIVTLFFYRLPIPMEESTESFPDGARGMDDFEWAIIHDACSKIFNDIEDGMEGAKVNTSSHEAKFAERFALLDVFSEGKGQSFAIRPGVSRGWLGGN